MQGQDELGSALRNGGSIVLAASTGGHLAQLKRISARLSPTTKREWITFRNAQSSSLLFGEAVNYVPYIGPRDALGIVRSFPKVIQAIYRSRADTCVSTGSALALAVLPVARLLRKRAVYIESVSRFDGPSVTGRILQLLWPSVELYTQHENWANGRWTYEFCLLEDYKRAPALEASPIRRVFVTLGTIRPYPFDLLVEKVRDLIDEDIEVIWQLGSTKAPAGLPGKVRTELSGDEMREAAEWADVVISHAGVGSALWLLDLGICPVLVPRRAVRGEHIDDHQEQIARELSSRQLAISVEVNEISYKNLAAAAASPIQRLGREAGQ